VRRKEMWKERTLLNLIPEHTRHMTYLMPELVGEWCPGGISSWFPRENYSVAVHWCLQLGKEGRIPGFHEYGDLLLRFDK
jgi:hypothetical protein